MEFKDYGFKPVDVIKGLNLYYSAKDHKYLHIEKGKHSYWHLLDKDVTEAINWLREEHDIFYTPGMKVEDDTKDVFDKDIFDTPRYRFLSMLSSELGFRTIVGPGNADKTEKDILRIVKHRNDELKNLRSQQLDEAREAEARKEFLRKLRCELGVRYPVVDGCIEKMEYDILERIGKLKEGNWPCVNGNTFAEFMRKQFPKDCEKWNVAPLEEGSVHDWVQYIFGILDEWRKRALKDEEEWDAVYEELGLNPADDGVKDVVAAIRRLREDRAKYKGMLNTMYGASCGDGVLPCYRDTCSNAKAIKERDAAKDALFELRAKIREVYRSVVDDEWDEHLSYTSAMNDINEEYKRVVHNFEERTAVGSLLGIPKEARDDINAIERSFTFSKKQYESLKEFRDSVCEIFDIPSNMIDNYILKKIHDVVDRYDELKDFRADICGALDIEGMLGTPKQNDKYILEQIEKLKGDDTSLDRYARFRSNVCTALCLGGETSDEDILKRVRMTRDCHEKLCKDYTELRKAIWDAMDRKPETLPEETARLVGEVRMLTECEKHILEFRDAVAEAIGITYPTTNNFILKRVADIYKDRGEARDLAMELDRKCIDLTAKNSDLQQKFQFQSGLRQQWHARWESENERANGVQKDLDREREKCRVKDISLETAKKQYEKVCNNLETAECALNGMRSKVRGLQDEKTKVISAIGQDIWDDCLK